MKYRPTKEAKEMLCKLLDRCMEITDNTTADVFFHYSPHTGCYTVIVHPDGWGVNDEGIWLTDITEITVENIIETTAKLEKICEELEGNENV